MQKEKSKIITFSGRFQPFGPHHYSAFQYLCEKFGDKNVWITTSNKIEYPNSPFSFSEKRQIITSMFDISITRIVEIKNPYDPSSLVIPKAQKNNIFITALSQKDADRLSHSNYFEIYQEDMIFLPMSEKGYIIVVPEFKFGGQPMSGTLLREGFAFERFKRKMFKEVYGRFDEDVFKLIVSRLSFMKLMKEEHLNV